MTSPVAPDGQNVEREAIIAAAKTDHDRTCSCDPKYLMSCPQMAVAILAQGRKPLHAAAPAVAPDQPNAVTRETFLRCTVEIWDGASEDANQVEDCGEVVDATWLATPIDGSDPHWHLVVIADV